MTKLLAALNGAIVSFAAWLLLLPWDLSEVDADGQLRNQGGADDYAGMIAAVALAVLAVSVGLLWSRSTRQWGVPFAVGGLVVWALLFAWRAAASETSGANMFTIPLLFAVIPVTLAAPLILRRLTVRLDDRPS